MCLDRFLQFIIISLERSESRTCLTLPLAATVVAAAAAAAAAAAVAVAATQKL